MYEKPWLSYEEQLNLLIDRNLQVTDRSAALTYLERIGYYRLSGYWYAFRERSGECCIWPKPNNKRKQPTVNLALDDFKIGATFQQAVDLYVFDKKLRLIVLDAIERIEIALRVDLSHTLGRNGANSYTEVKYFSDKFSKDFGQEGLTRHHLWLTNHAQLINRSKEKFIQHHKNKYGISNTHLGCL